MARPLKLEITESAEELKALLGRQKTAQGKERVQAIYLLKLGTVKTIGELVGGVNDLLIGFKPPSQIHTD